MGMRPSESLQKHSREVRAILSRFGVLNPRVFGSVSRGQDTEASDLDILVEAPEGTTFFDLARIENELAAILGCRVELLTAGSLAPDVAKRAEADFMPMP
ncbi:MAG: nucleotidyltransferase [Tardiphaga sp.]|nr:nucleotidyltransferase [Tardiphaga sp.]